MRARLEAAAPALHAGALVVVSSQVPVGFTRDARAATGDRAGAISLALPENLRLGPRTGRASRGPERVVVGLGRTKTARGVAPLLASFAAPRSSG